METLTVETLILKLQQYPKHWTINLLMEDNDFADEGYYQLTEVQVFDEGELTLKFD